MVEILKSWAITGLAIAILASLSAVSWSQGKGGGKKPPPGSDSISPDPVTDLAADSASPTSIALSWLATADDGSDPASAPKGDGPAIGAAPAADANEQRAPQPVDESASGVGSAETYTVLFDREGAPTRGIVVGRTGEGRRFLANTPEDRGLLESLARSEKMGFTGSLQSRDGRSTFDPS